MNLWTPVLHIGMIVLFGIVPIFCILFGSIQIAWRKRPPLRLKMDWRRFKGHFYYGEMGRFHNKRQLQEGIGAILAGLFLLLFPLMIYLEKNSQ